MPAVEQVDQAVADGKIQESTGVNVRKWLTEPQYAPYREAVEAIVAAEDYGRLDTLFWEVIDFGTGGRRGLMDELGSATINARTIAESAHGLAAYWKEQSGRTDGRAVIACDTRNRSLEFARITATTLAAHGFKVFYFDSHRATPALSFAVRHLGCDVGAMISASHNPPSDNGFKAYWSHGGQVLAPHDRGIIEQVFEAKEIPTVDFDEAVSSGQIEIVGEAIDRAYLDEVKALSLSDAREIPAIFSPLHGVGGTSVFLLLQELGFDGVAMFEPQAEPDGDFTNVPDQLPNPERTEVFGPAIEQAKEDGSELVLASDPDADRLGVVVKTRDGEFVHLTGNRVGALICDFVTSRRAARGELTGDHYVVETMVTTPLVGRVAESRGCRVVDNLLVGFKFIGQTMDQEGPDDFVFGTEESLGYLAGSYCRDKDACIAAMYIMELAAELRLDGKTLADRLDEIFVEHGYFIEGQKSKVCTGPTGRQQIDQIMAAFRAVPPKELAGIDLGSVRDYQTHEVRSLPDNAKTEELPEPSGNLLMFETVAGDQRFRVAARPSGTEPKIKFYFFGEADVSSADALAATKSATDAKLDEIADSLMAWIDGVIAG